MNLIRIRDLPSIPVHQSFDQPIVVSKGDVAWDEALQAGSFIGQKFVLNEFVAYTSFAPEIANLSPKTAVIISFALCGFANLAAIALIIGGLGGIAPSRRQDIAEMGLRAVIAATLANLLSAAIAGMLI